MNIYVGKWDLLPANWEGFNGLSERAEEQISDEVLRQGFLCAEPNYIGIYDAKEFEDTFNQCLTHFIDSREYWIKIFE